MTCDIIIISLYVKESGTIVWFFNYRFHLARIWLRLKWLCDKHITLYIMIYHQIICRELIGSKFYQSNKFFTYILTAHYYVKYYVNIYVQESFSD